MKQEIIDLLEKYKWNLEEICEDFIKEKSFSSQLAEKLGEVKKEKIELIKELEQEEEIKEVQNDKIKLASKGQI